MCLLTTNLFVMVVVLLLLMSCLCSQQRYHIATCYHNLKYAVMIIATRLPKNILLSQLSHLFWLLDHVFIITQLMQIFLI